MRIFNYFVFVLLVFLSQPALTQEKPLLPEGIMATRGAGSVSREVFDAKISKIPEKDREGFLLSAARVEKILVDLLLTSQLKAEAQAAGFDKGNMQYRMQLAADKELINAWLAYYVDSQPPADYRAMAHEYYLLNKDQMVTVSSRDVTHLLVSNKQSTNEEVKLQAQIYMDQINLDASVFDQLILDHSEDPGVKSNQGHFKDVKEGDMVPAFEEAAFALESPGDFSGLVQSAYGIHIIRLDKINPPRVMAFEEVQKQLMAVKEKEHKERVRYAYLDDLAGLEARISTEELQAMVDRYFHEDQQQESSMTPESE